MRKRKWILTRKQLNELLVEQKSKIYNTFYYIREWEKSCLEYEHLNIIYDFSNIKIKQFENILNSYIIPIWFLSRVKRELISFLKENVYEVQNIYNLQIDKINKIKEKPKQVIIKGFNDES